MIGLERLGDVLEHYPELEGPVREVGREAPGDDIWIEAPQGRVLFDAGGRRPRYALLVEGRIRVVFPARDGTELFLYLLRPGELCAMTALALLTDTPSRVRAIAETPVRGVGLSGETFHRLLEESGPFRKKVFDSLALHVDALLQLLDETAKLDLSMRLARRLVSSAPVITMTHQELAEGLGCSRERISRLLERFQRSGWVKLKRGVIEVLDADALRQAGLSDEER